VIVDLLITSLFIVSGSALNPGDYSVAVLALVVPLSLWAELGKKRIRVTRVDGVIVLGALFGFGLLFYYFQSVPRLFTPDETNYIFGARMGLPLGNIQPMGVLPDASPVGILVIGRLGWTYLLASFLGSTGLSASESGLIGVLFLPMIGLTCCSLIRNQNFRLLTFVLVLIQPALFAMSDLVLNDLAVAYLALFSIVYFTTSFRRVENRYAIDGSKFCFALVSMVLLLLIKFDPLVIAAAWIVLLYLYLSHSLALSRIQLLATRLMLLLPILYEIVFDLPYFISVWVLRENSVFGTSLPFSPLETVVRQFVAPSFDPNQVTAFHLSLVDWVAHLYQFLSPESLSVAVAAIAIIFPLTLRRETRLEEHE